MPFMSLKSACSDTNRNMKCVTFCGLETSNTLIILVDDVTRYKGLKTDTCTLFEPSRGKTNNVVSEQARHKPVCIVTEAG